MQATQQQFTYIAQQIAVYVARQYAQIQALRGDDCELAGSYAEDAAYNAGVLAKFARTKDCAALAKALYMQDTMPREDVWECIFAHADAAAANVTQELLAYTFFSDMFASKL